MQRSLDHARMALARHTPRQIPLEDGLKRAAVAAVLRHREGLEVLMIRRAEHPKDPWSGHMAFPGGRVDPEDPGPLSAARRETSEEVGLDLERRGSLIGELSHVPAMAHGKMVPMVIFPFVFAVADDPELSPDASEVQETLWVPLSFLADRSNRETLSRTYGGVPMKWPCYHYEGRMIWGLTLKMLDELVKVLQAP